MPLLNVNLEDAPTSVPPVPSGIYTMEIMGVPEYTDLKSGETDDDGNKMKKIVVKCRIKSDIPEADGRNLTSHIGVSKSLVGLKRIALSASLTWSPEGIDTDLLAGCTVRARVKSRAWRDEETGETRETSGIDEFLIPGDEK